MVSPEALVPLVPPPVGVVASPPVEPHDEPLSLVLEVPQDEAPELDSGAVPQPAGSLVEALGAASAPAGVAVEDEESPSAPWRFKKAVTSDPVGTMATTSHPSPDFSVSLDASEDAS